MTPCSRKLARNSLASCTSSRTLASSVSTSGSRYSKVPKASVASVVASNSVVMMVTFLVGPRPAWADRFLCLPARNE